MKKLLIFASHPIQYQAPIFKLLAKQCELIVIYGYLPKPKNQADAGFGVAFEWDVPLLDGYNYEVAELKNPETANTQTRTGLIIKDPASILLKHQPDAVIVHGWFPQAMVQMIRACKQLEIPVWVRGDSNLQMQDSMLKRWFKEVYFRWLFSKVSGFLYVGTLNKQLYQHYGVEDHRLIFAPHCIDTGRFIHNSQRQTAELSDTNKLILGFIGKFIPIKNVELLLKAVFETNQLQKFKLIIAGDGLLKNELQSLASRLKLDCEFIGFINQSELVSKFYSKIDLLVFPSHHETWGLVVNEAQTYGVPAIVGQKVGCGIDLCPEDCFNSNDIKELSRALLDWHSNYDVKKNENLKYIDSFSLQACSDGYIKVLER